MGERTYGEGRRGGGIREDIEGEGNRGGEEERKESTLYMHV